MEGDESNVFEMYDILILPLILGLVELFKVLGLNPKYSPLVAIFFGIVLGVVYLTDFDWKQGILVGVILGLSASGLYSGGKNTFEKREKND